MLTALRGLAALVLVFAMCAAAQADVRDEFKPSGKIWTVDQDGGGDFETISAAIEAAAPGDGIRVRPGVYRESLSIEKELYIESAEEDRDDVVIETENNPCVYFAAERGAVRGMTLRNSGYRRHACVHIASGELLLADNDVSSKISDGVRIWGGDSNPAVIGNRIYENEFHGVYAQAAAKGRFENNEIYDNTFSGAYVEGAADLVFIGNRIYGNKKAGIYMTDGAKGRFENNEIFGNTNNSVQVTRGADPLFTGNRIFDGKSAGVSFYENGKGRFENNEIYGNTFSGVIVEDAEPVFTDNRIYGNKEDGVWVFAAAKGRFENNEIYGNTFSGVFVKERAEPVFTGNRVYDNKNFGILVNAAKGRFENNEIYKNKFSGVYVISRADPVFINNRVYDNKEHGIAVVKGGKGQYENNDISGNKKEQFIGPKESGPLPPETAAIGMLEAGPPSGNVYNCTAFLTGPDTVVTAAHCVKSYSGDVYELSDIKFNDLSENGLPPVSAAEYLHVGGYTSYASRTNTFREFLAPMGKDIAVIRISEPLGDTLGWLRKGEVDWDEIADGGEYEIIGAPEGYLIRQKPCALHPDVTRMWEGIYSSVHEAFETGAFFHTCATPPGYSGGPVLREDNGELTWIGVNSSRIIMRWPGYPPVEDVGTAMILQPGGDWTAGE
ncbi:MAG: right-handed parallel beta-helix repeat-containing protein [Rhodospirillales bacterium]